MGKVVALRRILLGLLYRLLQSQVKSANLSSYHQSNMKCFYTVSLSQILLRSPHKNYLGFIRAYYKKKFEILFILPKEKALATYHLLLVVLHHALVACENRIPSSIFTSLKALH